MRIVLIGAGGQLGTALMDRLSGEIVAPSRHDLDLTDAQRIHSTLAAVRPDLIINAAAYNFVDRAEDEPERAFAVNALGVGVLARSCGELDVALVHVSSDYVFGLDDGRSTPYSEGDPPAPTGAYALGKLAGEGFVRAYCPKHFVLRTCGLYGRAKSPGKGNFVETMLRLGRERGAVSVVDDQWCTPTSAADLAAAIVELVPTGQFGLYHATNTGSSTWCGFASEIFRRAGMKVSVRPISTAQFGARARRPGYSVLDCSKLARAIGRPMRSWQEALDEYVEARMTEDGR
jgi:dTDP-4-dehydrorhamnose reductase